MHILWFDEYEDEHHDRVGGKCASLGAMIAAGLPVPPGFAVTVDAFKESMTATGRWQRIHEALAGLDATDLDSLEAVAAEAKRLIVEGGATAAVEADIRDAYERLSEQCGDEVPVAVRSSATAEDLPGASFAGEHDTYLWVRGADQVVERVVACWASLYTDRAISYRAEMGFPHEAICMSVGVQQMVRPKAAGVAFTLDPTNGDRSKVAIDASWGLGESVVSGSVTPDNFLVDKVVFEIVKRVVSAKETEAVVVDDDVVHLPLDEERAAAQSLTDDEVRAVARLARQAEKHFGSPQDVEWAVDVLGGDSVVYLLQSRPETVWSQRPRQQVSSGVTDTLAGVVSALLSPVKVRKASDDEST